MLLLRFTRPAASVAALVPEGHASIHPSIRYRHTHRAHAHTLMHSRTRTHTEREKRDTHSPSKSPGASSKWPIPANCCRVACPLCSNVPTLRCCLTYTHPPRAHAAAAAAAAAASPMPRPDAPSDSRISLASRASCSASPQDGPVQRTRLPSCAAVAAAAAGTTYWAPSAGSCRRRSLSAFSVPWCFPACLAPSQMASAATTPCLSAAAICPAPATGLAQPNPPRLLLWPGVRVNPPPKCTFRHRSHPGLAPTFWALACPPCNVRPSRSWAFSLFRSQSPHSSFLMLGGLVSCSACALARE